jgi:hypothetical protein
VAYLLYVQEHVGNPISNLIDNLLPAWRTAMNQKSPVVLRRVGKGHPDGGEVVQGEFPLATRQALARKEIVRWAERNHVAGKNGVPDGNIAWADAVCQNLSTPADRRAPEFPGAPRQPRPASPVSILCRRP